MKKYLVTLCIEVEAENESHAIDMACPPHLSVVSESAQEI